MSDNDEWITLREAEQKFGWSRVWWAQRINSKAIDGKIDPASKRKTWLVRLRDAAALSKEMPYDEKSRGRERKFQDTNDRLKDGVKRWREKSVGEGSDRVEVLLSAPAIAQLAVLRERMGDAGVPATKRKVIETLILDTITTKGDRHA